MFFYLKVNRNEGYSIRNLRHWLEIVKQDDNEFVIICDNKDLEKRIVDNIPFLSSENFIVSNRDDFTLKEITVNNTSDFWNNASYSHLTTFWDARQRGLAEFYNIDADDTCFCVEADRAYQILMEVRKDSIENNVSAYSFDMSHSRRNGAFWTFGVTYTNNKIDWFRYLMEHCYDGFLSLPEYDEMILPSCIDTYFTYINSCSDLKLETFYVENCKFIHYSNDFVYRPWNSWFGTYRNGRIIKPVLNDFYELTDMGDVPIAADVRRIDVGLTTKEQVEWLIGYACEAERNKRIMFRAMEHNVK